MSGELLLRRRQLFTFYAKLLHLPPAIACDTVCRYTANEIAVVMLKAMQDIDVVIVIVRVFCEVDLQL